MIADLKPYRAYKDSGVPWLGQVPEHWEVQPLGQIGRLFKGNGGSKADEVSEGIPCVRYGDLYTRHEFFIQKTKACVAPPRAPSYTTIRYGDVLFAASGETIEDIGRSAENLLDCDARCGGDVLLLRPKRDFEPGFLGYAADSPASRNQKACMGRGFTVVHIYGSELKRLILGIPPLPEQSAIVRFLDHADCRIRRYIGAKRQLVALLNEQKQAIIHRAVTRGLDPSVRLKPSGVEWLGDVPEHWAIRKLGNIARVFNGTTPSRSRSDYWNGGTIPWVSSGKVNDGIVRSPSELITETAFRQTSLAVVPRCSVILGLVGQGKMRGMCALLDIDACINQYLAAIVPGKLVKGPFLHYLITAFYKPIRDIGRGGNQEALNCELVSLLRLPLPPRDEQQLIVDHLDRELSGIDRGLERIRREIELLNEYRLRLIADVPPRPLHALNRQRRSRRGRQLSDLRRADRRGSRS